jgi:RNA polymerase sigma-B factor
MLAMTHVLCPSTTPQPVEKLPGRAGSKGGHPTRSASTVRCHSKAVRQRNQRVETYRALVRPLAIHYARCSQECSEDLIQVGLLGLIRAAELYSKERKIPFEAFARPHIRGAILHYLRDVAPRVRLPRRQAELQERLNRVFSAMLADQRPGDRNPTISPDQCRRHLGVSDEQWILLTRQRDMNKALPLESAPPLERERARPVGASHPDDPEKEAGPAHGSDAERVRILLAQVGERERQVVRRVVLNGWSYRKVALEMGVSPMTVQRVLKRGLNELRERLDSGAFRLNHRVDRVASVPPGC